MADHSWSAARQVAATACRALEPVAVPVREALGCVLAGDVRAQVGLPVAPTAAMDGYAVRGAGPWRRIGALLAGEEWSGVLRTGEAVEIATGAPVPAGATAVLRYEDAEAGCLAGSFPGVSPTSMPVSLPALSPMSSADDRAVLVGSRTADLPHGRHIRAAGNELAAGQLLASAGERVTALTVGLLAAAGLDRVGVRPVPRVAVLVTGDELVDEGLPTASRPRDALGPALPGLLAGLGADAAHPTRVGDTVEELTCALRLALDVRERTAQVDLVLVTGASSVGPADHLHKALADLGAELLVDGVACRPGHPQLLARLPGGTPVCGLPGHPFAAVAAVMTLVAPVLAVLDGRRPDPVTRCRWDGPRREHDVMLVPVRLIGGTPQPVGPSHSASLVAVAAATHLLVVPPGSDDPQMLRLPTGLVH